MTGPTPTRLGVSVALCTYNGERFIAEQVRSILALSRTPRQLVISDDASRDDTVAIAVALVEEHNRSAAEPVDLVVLRNDPGLGVAANFAQAIAACTADLVALCDQDDVWHPERLAVMAARFEAEPDLTLLHADARRVDAAGHPLEQSLFESLHVSPAELAGITSGDALSVFVRRNLVTGATTLFRRPLAEVALPVPPGWIHDEWLGIVAAATGRVDVELRALVDYRQHENNQIGAGELGLAGKVGRLRQPRTARNATLHLRARSLVARLTSLPGVDDTTRRVAEGKLEHERHRDSLPAARLLRLAPVLRAAARGGYRHYGLGMQDVLRDLVQPVG